MQQPNLVSEIDTNTVVGWLTKVRWLMRLSSKPLKLLTVSPAQSLQLLRKLNFGMQRESQRPCTSKLWTQEMPKHRSISAIDRQGRWCFEGRYDGGGDVPTSGDREQCRYTERGQICHDLNIAVAE
jgi:hypothetical protein